MSNWFGPRSRPRAVEGGLKARSTRGAIAKTWWSERFIEVLEGIGMGNRLQRGRSYARMGQVISMDVRPGSVTAQVQGSRPRPYRVRIGIAAFGKSEWARAEQTLAGNAWYTAMLLSGEMPDDIEDVFAGLGLSLFPATAGGPVAGLLLPRPRGGVQAPCRDVFPARRVIRRGPVRHPCLAWACACGLAGQPAGRPLRRSADRRPWRTAGAIARRLPRLLLRAPTEQESRAGETPPLARRRRR